MAKHWVKAIQPITRQNPQGAHVRHMPGDWFEVRNMEMRQLIADRRAVPAGGPGSWVARGFDLDDCGVVITNGSVEAGIAQIHGVAADMPVVSGFELDYPRTLLWDTNAPLRMDLMPVGFHRLMTGWQIAAPLWRYRTLARDIGTSEERARTEEVIRDLRVPVYETRCMYVLRCPDTEALIEAWTEERQGSTEDKLAFMRALYRIKPVMCALPTTWMVGVKP
jgi:hypothetical protein